MVLLVLQGKWRVGRDSAWCLGARKAQRGSPWVTQPTFSALPSHRTANTWYGDWVLVLPHGASRCHQWLLAVPI